MPVGNPTFKTLLDNTRREVTKLYIEVGKFKLAVAAAQKIRRKPGWNYHGWKKRP